VDAAISGVAESSGIRAYGSGCRELGVCGGRQRRRMQSTVMKDAEDRPNLRQRRRSAFPVATLERTGGLGVSASKDETPRSAAANAEQKGSTDDSLVLRPSQTAAQTGAVG
jgi:hypothetical protein